MATTKTARQVLHSLIVSWFASADPKYMVPIDANNIKRYATAPADTSPSPNWCILTSLGTTHADFVTGGEELPARFALLLLSRYDKSDEASKEAALNWIDDAEEMLVEQLAASANTDDWYKLSVSGRPRRDIVPQFYGRWRTAQILIDMEKK